MIVKNGKCIRRLSFKTLLSSGKRNIIAIIAIALTTLMFTAIFTVALSFNSSYQNYLARQLGGYSHGAFKEVNEEQIEKISAHKKIKETGVRTVIGLADATPFDKETAEVSYMDDNCTKWSFALPCEGRTPEKEDEISMDRKALELLGAEGTLGEKITITYNLYGINGEGGEITDTFTLCGIFEYDDLLPVHFINISKDYMEKMRKTALESRVGDFRTDLNVMLSNSFNIEDRLIEICYDLGFTDVRVGASWAYTASSFSFAPGEALACIAFIVLIIFTGYLVIYNIFQISVAGDVRFYGLLKTIGVTPKQLKKIIRNQALMLCTPGIPLGFIAGFFVGALLLPLVMENTTLGKGCSKISASPVIFIAAAVFSLITVLISCRKPGKTASRISPVEATRYTDTVKKASKKSRSVNSFKMAFSNLGRNRKKTTVVIVSLSLSLVLLNILVAFVNGFDEDKYLGHTKCADFLVSSSDYFRTNPSDFYYSDELVENIKDNTNPSTIGCAYTTNGPVQAWMTEDAWFSAAMEFGLPDPKTELSLLERKDELIKEFAVIEGFDAALVDKLCVVSGSLEPLKEAGGKNVAIVVPEEPGEKYDYEDIYPKIGESIVVEYSENYSPIDVRTGEPADETTPYEFIRVDTVNKSESEYTVCALVSVPYEIGNRSFRLGYSLVMNKDTFINDSVSPVIPMLIAFDTADEESEMKAEEYLSKLTFGEMDSLMYESKETLRAEFNEFKSMFIIVGGVLCGIIALVGILNFFNAIMTDIITRAKEFAVLQAIGMTGKQLKQMIITEGSLYAVGSALFALILSLILNPFEINAINGMFWFCTARFTILPVVAAIPVFALIAFSVSVLLYKRMEKESIVERIKEL